MPPLSLKRITKEVANINDKDYIEHSRYSKEFKNYLASLTFFLTEINKDTSANYLVIKKKDKLFLELSIPHTYPFRSYKVINYNNNGNNNNGKNNNGNNNDIYNGLCYYKYINNISAKIANYDKNIYKFFYKCLYNCEPYFLMLKKYDCYCCSSIMCSNLWCPSYTFVNIILEYLEISFIERYSSPINYKYLTSIYNSIFFKFPPEICDLILSYL
jgi:hypothetical protein